MSLCVCLYRNSFLFLVQQHIETKVFTPSTKTITEKSEPASSFASKSNESSAKPAQPTLSAILSAGLNKNTRPQPQQQPTAGEAFVKQVQTKQQDQAQQQSQASQQQFPSLSQPQQPFQVNKAATESIKSLVGLGSGPPSGPAVSQPNYANQVKQRAQPVQQQQQPQQSQQASNRIANANRAPQQPVGPRSVAAPQVAPVPKIPEAAVEMPSSLLGGQDANSISNLSVQFGSALEFGVVPSGPNSALQNDSIFPHDNQAKKPQQVDQQSKSLGGGLSTLTNDNSQQQNQPPAANLSGYRSQQQQQSQQPAVANKNILPNNASGTVLPTLSSAASSNDHRVDGGNKLSSSQGYQPNSSKPSALQQQASSQSTQDNRDKSVDYLTYKQQQQMQQNAYQQQQQQHSDHHVPSFYGSSGVTNAQLQHNSNLGGAGAGYGYVNQNQYHPFMSQQPQLSLGPNGANTYGNSASQANPNSNKGIRGDLNDSTVVTTNQSKSSGYDQQQGSQVVSNPALSLINSTNTTSALKNSQISASKFQIKTMGFYFSDRSFLFA